METMAGKKPRQRRSFTPEFKAEVVALVRQPGNNAGSVAREMGLTDSAVREWVRQAERDEGVRADGLTSSGAGRDGPAAQGVAGGARGTRHPQACGGFLREGDPVSVFPFIEAEKAGQSQRRQGVRVARGLPVRLLRLAPPPPLRPTVRR